MTISSAARSNAKERALAGRCNGAVRRVAPLLLLMAFACAPSGPASAQVQPSPKTAVHTFAGGCAGTVLTDAQPPQWAQGGWTRANGPWPVPWAFGTNDDAVKDSPSGANVVVEGRPLGEYQPVVTIAGGPSITDVPTAGCWTFRLIWASSGYARSSIINLEVLPAGTLPPY